MPIVKTSAIAAIAMAFGIAAGATVVAVAQDQPNMQAALDHLVAADTFLARANNNKGGHREKARSLITLAISEVKEGIKHAD